MSAPDGIESIIRQIVREEIDRAADGHQSVPAADERKLLYSVADVAAVTGMSAQYVRNDIRSGRLVATQPSGSKYLIAREAASRYAIWLQAGRP
ncbi:helix-turn-helix domain-containing protein [Curtobacterium flaccumfaciens pv. betae]|uniref:helix-turn-helix domain-containing protein n=1 Tax=Curtobacterium flaccumfaciens TaxID=2035 RepID=UPI00265A4197|nr:helix-turn-helix domain-containing protein [Curtobacterium flaccumfaciens]MCS5513159.1 helix-turn-helix domain-containing protein [Curtobacterium flaccumfaciens pv. betae]